MSPSPRPDDTQHPLLNINMLGFALVGLALLVSLYYVIRTERTLNDPNTITVEIAHWQLELGYADAMNAVVAAYEAQVNGDASTPPKFGKPVRIKQLPTTERVYGQWVNTRLISGDAPALIQLGDNRTARDDQYLVRFFLPLTDLIDEVNPYNQGTPLERTPWRETFVDGMAGGYRPQLQEYLSVPTTLYPVRLFYNEQVLIHAKKLLAEDGKLPTSWSDPVEPPRTFGQLMLLCDQMGQMVRVGREGYRRFQPGDDARSRLMPIAGSAYGVTEVFLQNYAVPFQANLTEILDTGIDGTIGGQESVEGYLLKRVSMQSPEVRAYWQCMRELTRRFGEGFVGMDRQQASFLFVAGEAGMICTGSWDAVGLIRQAAHNGYQVRIIGFPLPGPDEPFGEFIKGPANEAAQTGEGKFGVYKFAPPAVREAAVDFLRFLTSQKGNAMFTSRAVLVPIIRGAPPVPAMEPFMPRVEGYPTGAAWRMSTEGYEALGGSIDGYRWPYLQGDTQKKLLQGYGPRIRAEREQLSASLSGPELQAAMATLDATWTQRIEDEAYDAFAAAAHERTLDPQKGIIPLWEAKCLNQVRFVRSQEGVLAAHALRALLDPRASDDAMTKYRRVLLQQIKSDPGAMIDGFRHLVGREPDLQ